jgi:hypothetical protein
VEPLEDLAFSLPEPDAEPTHLLSIFHGGHNFICRWYGEKPPPEKLRHYYGIEPPVMLRHLSTESATTPDGRKLPVFEYSE